VKYVGLLAFALAFGSAGYAQDVIAAKAGVIHYTEGDVNIAGKPVVMKSGDFPEMQKGQELTTGLGRAEVLLGPGVFLRVAEQSAFRLVTNALEDTRLDLTAGSILIEAGEFEPKHHGIVVTVGSTQVEVVKRGLYRIDFNPGLLRVYEGNATVIAGGQPVTTKEGRQTTLGAVPNPERFNKERGDAFYRWAARRSSYIAMANIAAAKRLHDNGTAGGWNTGNWLFNPYFGCFTYIPASGLYRSPFGWAFYSPRTVERVYYRPPAQIYNPPSMGGFDGGIGHRGYSDYGGRSSMGSHSAGGSAAPPPAPAAPAPSGGPRTGDAGGGRSSAGGR
jgi:hypothetical protein